MGLSSVRLSTLFITSTDEMQVLPLTIPIAYFLLLPNPSSFTGADIYEDSDDTSGQTSALPYAPLPTSEDEQLTLLSGSEKGVALSAGDKWYLVKPMLVRYMLPLCEHYAPSFRIVTNVVAHIVCVYLVRTCELRCE